MKAVVQRVAHASVAIGGKVRSSIASGLLVLLGIHRKDTEEDIDWMARKIAQLRVFEDEDGLMNRSVADIEGEILVVSQFTLIASVKKGNRPSFNDAASPEKGKSDYEAVSEKLGLLSGRPVKTGIFAADMKVELLNDGPVTIVFDSKNRT